MKIFFVLINWKTSQRIKQVWSREWAGAVKLFVADISWSTLFRLNIEWCFKDVKLEVKKLVA